MAKISSKNEEFSYVPLVEKAKNHKKRGFSYITLYQKS